METPMAKAMRSVRRVRTTHKDKKLRLPLPPAVHEFAASCAVLRAELGAAMRALPETTSRAQVEAAREVDEAARVKLREYLDAAITKHIGRIGDLRLIKPRPLRTLDDLVIAAAIAMESRAARSALASMICDAAGFDYRKELYRS